MTEAAPPCSAAARPDYRFGALVAAIFAATLLPRIVVHVLWRDEFQAWMLATSGNPSLAEVFRRADYEGHPYAWFTMLRGLSAVWADPLAMKLLHAFFASAIVYVIATFGPMRRHLRVLLCLGYFFLFEYAVVSRNYGLGVLPLLAFAAVRRTWRPDALRTQAGLLALAAQANVFAGLVAIAAAGWAGVRWVRGGRQNRGQYVTAIVIVGAGVLLLCYQLIGAPDRNFAAAAFRPSPDRLMRTLAGFWQVFLPVPAVDRFWWNSNFLDPLEAIVPLKYVVPVLGAMVGAAAIWLLPQRRDVRLLWVIGAGLMVAFGTLRYPGFPRHSGHLYVVFVLAWWLSHGTAAHPKAAATPGDRRRSRGVLILLIVQAIAGLAASAADVVLPFSASRAAGDFIAARYPDALVIANTDYQGSPVAGELGRPLYYIDRSRWGSFIRWDGTPTAKLAPSSYAAAAEALNADARPVVVLLSQDAEPVPDPARFRHVASFENSTNESERYRVYELIPSPSRTGATTAAVTPALRR